MKRLALIVALLWAGGVSAQVPELARWQSNMTTYGKRHCDYLKAHTDAFDPLLSATYYDGSRVYYQIADYTKDASWNACAQASERIYRDEYLIKAQGAVPGYWLFPHGLGEDFRRNNDAISKNAVSLLATKGMFAVLTTPLASTADAMLSREVAYVIMTYLENERLGAPRPARLAQLVTQAHDHIQQLFVRKTTQYVKPFMVGLLAEALIRYAETTPAAKALVVRSLIIAADGLWPFWVDSAGAFKYVSRSVGEERDDPAADLNLLIAPMYAWLHRETGQVRFKDRGDLVFAGGVKGSYLSGAKQFNQSYRWSFDYVKWRGEQQPTPAPVVTAAPSPTATGQKRWRCEFCVQE